MAGESRKSKSGRRLLSAPKLDLTAQQWVVALLIGLATVFAAGYGWRAAQIGSTAAFDDRQSISQTISAEQQSIDVALAVGNDTREYTDYLVDYAIAAELDNQADGLERAGEDTAATAARREARFLRRSSTQRTADAGVFGRSTIADDLAQPSAIPRPFNFEEDVKARTAEAETAIDSPGQLNPNLWAEEAEAIRDRVNGLAVWALIMLIAVLMFTIAEANSARRSVFYSSVTIGVMVLLFGAVGGLTVDFFV